jgi:hypothetical protein
MAEKQIEDKVLNLKLTDLIKAVVEELLEHYSPPFEAGLILGEFEARQIAAGVIERVLQDRHIKAQ